MNISVIIPVHECDDNVTPLLTRAVDSIERQKDVDTLPVIYVVHPVAIKECVNGWKDSMIRKHEKFNFENIVLVENEGKTDYQAQVNLGVKLVTTDYFSVLEFDDEYGDSYFKNASSYTVAYPEIDFFMTMMIEVNEKNEGIKMTNETVWAQQFVGENGEMGYLNANALKQYTDFKLSGAVLNKSEFENIGGYKSNIKLTFMYEFLLRALNNTCKIYSIPKIGYKHLATREGSLFDDYQKNMNVNERKFWFETATKESNFVNDRVIDMSGLEVVVAEK